MATLEGFMAGVVLVRGIMMAVGHIIRTPGTTGITVHSITVSMAMPTHTMTIATPSMCSRTTDAAPDEPTSLIMSVQKELARLGYYHGQIDGMTGSETAQALRWFQSVDKLPVSGQIDSATVQALRIG